VRVLGFSEGSGGIPADGGVRVCQSRDLLAEAIGQPMRGGREGEEAKTEHHAGQADFGLHHRIVWKRPEIER
jgi:hypothetical protein